MMENMKDENTIYDDEKTLYQNRNDEVKPIENKKNVIWGKAMSGAATGVVLGAASTLLTSGTPPTSIEVHEEVPHPEWTDGEIQVATAVNDDMTFSEAFEAARAETGEGGVFEWHGYIYSTYTEDEWNNMTADERAEYGSHLNWVGDVTADKDEVPVVDSEQEVEVLGVNVDSPEGIDIDGEDVVVIDVEENTEGIDVYDQSEYVEEEIFAEPFDPPVDISISDEEMDYLADDLNDDYIEDFTDSSDYV